MASKSPPPLSQKSSLDSSLHGHVDLALKRLKLISRRISANLNAVEEESRILERLYYKGKNQHRVSLFWRRVGEMRRFCCHLNASELLSTVNQIRYMFYDKTNVQNRDILRTPWTHVPECNALTTITRCLSSSRQLLMKASERFLVAYCSFKRAMQTGIFLQLTLTLSAIACRLHASTQLLMEVHEELVTTLCNLLKLSPLSPTGPHDSGKERSEPSKISKKSKDKSEAQSVSLELAEPTQKMVVSNTLDSKPPSGGGKSTTIISHPRRKRKPVDEIDAIFRF